MTSYSYKTVQRIPADIGTVWDFFSDPGNLAVITPSYLDFRVVSRHHGTRMYPGQIIEYIIRPVAGIPVYWTTEITHVENRRFFVDEQRSGPYRLWHHQHHFREIPGGVEMTDIVHYRIRLGFLGRVANALWVSRQIDRIFSHRAARIETIFGAWIPRLTIASDA